MAGTSVQVEGAETFARTLRAAADGMADPKAAAEEASRIIAVEASTRAPRRTGRLAGSITPAPANGEARAVSGLVYAGPVDHGWPAHNIAPARFMEAALDAAKQRVIDAYGRDVETNLAKVRGV